MGLEDSKLHLVFPRVKGSSHESLCKNCFSMCSECVITRCSVLSVVLQIQLTVNRCSVSGPQLMPTVMTDGTRSVGGQQFQPTVHDDTMFCRWSAVPANGDDTLFCRWTAVPADSAWWHDVLSAFSQFLTKSGYNRSNRGPWWDHHHWKQTEDPLLISAW